MGYLVVAGTTQGRARSQPRTGLAHIVWAALGILFAAELVVTTASSGLSARESVIILLAVFIAAPLLAVLGNLLRRDGRILRHSVLLITAKAVAAIASVALLWLAIATPEAALVTVGTGIAFPAFVFCGVLLRPSQSNDASDEHKTLGPTSQKRQMIE